MRAVTWTQVAQYLVLILAYLVPLTWLSVQQTGNLMPAFGHGAQLVEIAHREAALSQDPAERDVADRWRQVAVQTEIKLRDVRAAMIADAQGMSQQIDTLRAQQAPLLQVQRAEREYLQRPRTEAQARLRYQQELERARTHALPLAGMPAQALPFAGGHPGAAPNPPRAFAANASTSSR